MKWQDLLLKTPRKTARVESGPHPTVVIEAAEPPGYGPPRLATERPTEPAEQPTRVRMKDQVMG